jgi:hypothetical protein
MWVRTQSVPEGADEVLLRLKTPQKVSLDDVASHEATARPETDSDLGWQNTHTARRVGGF